MNKTNKQTQGNISTQTYSKFLSFFFLQDSLICEIQHAKILVIFSSCVCYGCVCCGCGVYSLDLGSFESPNKYL
jgi:hypothetical protein